MKFIPYLITASVILLLSMASADFAMTGHVDLLGTSLAISLPLACAVAFRLACRAPARQSRLFRRK